ncbi:unnamed protein product [Cercopithifilaria johnstoni]|uniref:Nematode cuticle collagen N-terminal domain-containing protein n=1 Tax=Cercopithifilaria johnstoni TaxID=2874296 RepID=A0A8J2PT47_9BILA|nr:unnamed protein product [Cercopithifilaria johnstoni]
MREKRLDIMHIKFSTVTFFVEVDFDDFRVIENEAWEQLVDARGPNRGKRKVSIDLMEHKNLVQHSQRLLFSPVLISDLNFRVPNIERLPSGRTGALGVNGKIGIPGKPGKLEPAGLNGTYDQRSLPGKKSTSVGPDGLQGLPRQKRSAGVNSCPGMSYQDARSRCGDISDDGTQYKNSKKA